jgi:integrase
MIETERPPRRKAKDRDGVYKRRGHWHFDYKDQQTGQWRSKTTGKTNYNDAKEFKREFLKSLNGQYNPSNDRLKFAEAADSYIEHRGVAASAGTVRLEKERLRAVKKLLAQIAPVDLKLKDFEDIRLIRTYQQKRIADGVGPRTVNMEGQLMRSILKHHDQWKLDGKYQPLPEPVSEAGRSLTPEEEVRLIDTAKSRPEWAVAYHGTILENETGMRGVEVRNLQLKRIDLMAAEIHLQKSKTKGGVRTVPLNADALESAKQLVMRAQKLGANLPDHYLLLALVNAVMERNATAVRVRRYDPTKPTKGWRSAWRKLTEKAGLKGLRGHDLRHNWITSHAEIGTPQSVLEAQAGHLSKRMSDHYKHISEKAARKASDALSRAKAEQRAEARAKMREEARVAGSIQSKSIPNVIDVGGGQVRAMVQ